MSYLMIIDDDEDFSVAAATVLRNAGYEVITAQDGGEALELAQVEQPDLIITDYQMPHKNLTYP